MFDRLRALLANPKPASPGEGQAEPDILRLSAAALLVEAASMDGEFSAEERTTIAGLLRDRFELTADQAESLLDQAETRIDAGTQLYPFTRAIKDELSEEERIEIVEMLWQVAYADGELDPHEDQLIRQVAGLIFVEDRDRGLARKRALAKLGLEG